MSGYGHPLRFGALLEPADDHPENVVALAELMETVGLDVVSLSDHPYWPQRLDTMTLLTMIVARTSRITVVSNLANLPLRPPTTLARTAATLDLLSHGRFELGIATGAQYMWNLIVAEGGPALSAGASIEALEEAVALIRALWTSKDPVTFEGQHYRLTEVQPGPAPAHDVPIWLGAYQPRMLRVTGRIADAWVPSSPYLPPEALGTANRLIDDAATEAGRSPSAIQRAYNIEGEFAATGTGFLRGPASMWAEQLAEVALEHGISTFVLYRVQDADVLRRFAAEVAPAVRELVTPAGTVAAQAN